MHGMCALYLCQLDFKGDKAALRPQHDDASTRLMSKAVCCARVRYPAFAVTNQLGQLIFDKRAKPRMHVRIRQARIA